jgi:hypothetical protein
MAKFLDVLAFWTFLSLLTGVGVALFKPFSFEIRRPAPTKE